MSATGAAEVASEATAAEDRSAGMLSLLLRFLGGAASMPLSIRHCAAVHCLPAAMSLSRAAHAVLVSSTGFWQQHRRAMVVFMAVCCSR